MKVLKMVLASSIAASALLANGAADLEISPYVGGHFFNANRDMKNTGEIGVSLEKALTNNGLAVMGSLGFAKTDRKSDGDDRNLGTYGLNLIKNYDTGTKLTPYAGIGAAGTFGDNAAMGPNALVGLKYKIAEAMNIKAEVSDNYLMSGKNDVKAIVGLGFLFGGEKKQVAPVAAQKVEPAKVVEAPKAVEPEKDSDGDGVVDSKDMCPNTPKGLKVDDKGCFTSANLKINFDNDKAVVKKEYMPKLEAFAKFLNSNEPVNVVIEGHTDNKASAKYNQKLSEKRANAVRDILIKEYKVDANRIKAVGYGLTKPIADNKTAAGRAENRRIMAVVDKESQTPVK